MSPMEELHFLDALLTVGLDAEFQGVFADPKEDDDGSAEN